MKRISAALAVLLCLAVPASAARVALVRTAGPGSSLTDIAISLDVANWRAALDLMGCDYDVITQSKLTNGNSYSATSALRTGVVPRGGPNSGTDTYGLFIHQNYAKSVTGTRLSNYNPDSLTLAAGWSSVPQILAGPLRIYSGSVVQNSAACSTGTSSSLNSILGNLIKLSLRQVGTPYTWDAVGGGPFYYRNDANALILNRTDPMIQRARLIIGGNAVAFNDNGATSAAFPDSMTNPATQFTSPGADTAVLWTRERRYTTGVDRAPLIFLIGTYAGNGTVGTDIAEKCMAIAIADSASGGVIVGRRAGWKPKDIAVVLSGAFSRTDGGAGTDVHDWVGTVSRDSAFVKAGIDSLKALNIPLMVTVNIDSVETYPNEKAWWFGWKNTTYSPESRTRASGGTGSAPAGDLDGSTVAGSSAAVDPFGLWRSRTLSTYDRAVNGTKCNGTDTTLSCLVQYMRDRLATYTGNLSRTIVASHFDYIPYNYNRATAPSQDSLAIALMRAGYDGAIQGVTAINSAGMTWAINSAGTVFAPDAWSPAGYSPRERSIVVRTPSSSTGVSTGPTQTFGRFRWLTNREIDEAQGTGMNTTHMFASELWTGLTSIGWYYPLVNYPHYVHSFQTSCSVLLIRANELGYSANNTANKTRRGYTHLRRTVNKVRAINAMKWQGSQPVIRFVQADDLTPQ